jgi:hypothetical protein
MEIWTSKISFIRCFLFVYQSIKTFDKRQAANIYYYDHLFLPSSLGNEVHHGVHGVSSTIEQELFDERTRNGDLYELVEQFRRSDPTGQSVSQLGLRFDQELVLFEMTELESLFDEIQYNGGIQKGENYLINLKQSSIADLCNETMLGPVEPIVCLPVSVKTKQKAIFGRTLTGNNKKSSSVVPSLNSEQNQNQQQPLPVFSTLNTIQNQQKPLPVSRKESLWLSSSGRSAMTFVQRNVINVRLQI